jgi:transposase
LATEIDPAAFKSFRHLAVWIGLTPKENSPDGKQRMGASAEAGNERLCRLLLTGATTVIRSAIRQGRNRPSCQSRLLPENRAPLATAMLPGTHWQCAADHPG